MKDSRQRGPNAGPAHESESFVTLFACSSAGLIIKAPIVKFPSFPAQVLSAMTLGHARNNDHSLTPGAQSPS